MEIAQRSDEEVTKLIRADGIDILVDLSGHTAGDRLGVFARRAAPIQVTYVGYVTTTGLPTMDYRVTDRWSDPVGETEQYFTEILLRPFESFICYVPPTGSPDVGELPAVRAGNITFASFNRARKINPIAQNADDYVELAVRLSADMERLRALRAGMRTRMLASPLMDAAGFTRALDASYREIWRDWCGSRARPRVPPLVWKLAADRARVGVMSRRPEPWVVDAEDPRAPPQEIWDAMSEEQRQKVVDELPSEFPPDEARPPEGDQHTEAVYGARTALRRFFEKTGRQIYVGTNLPVYYPGGAMFSPDVMAVLDVPTHARSSWIVSKEGKGLDLALEVIVLGNRRKDVERNVAYYAELSIREYFVFDRPKLRLNGFRLRETARAYEPIVPQHGHYPSAVLGLDLLIERDRLRFYAGDAELPGAEELITKLESFVDDLERRLTAAEQLAEAEAQRAQAEAQRARAEAERAQVFEARLKEALAEIERLKRGK